jgi:hypothetical protein
LAETKGSRSCDERIEPAENEFLKAKEKNRITVTGEL